MDNIFPYREPTNNEIRRFNSVLREKILGIERQRQHLVTNTLKNINSEENNKVVELPDSDMFEYVPMF